MSVLGGTVAYRMLRTIAPAEPHGMNGSSYAGRRASRAVVTSEMVRQADVIFGMDYQNQAQVLSRFPSARKKVRLIGTCSTRHQRPIEIGDPCHAGETETRGCYCILRAPICSPTSRIQSDLQELRLGKTD